MSTASNNKEGAHWEILEGMAVNKRHRKTVARQEV